MLANLSLQLKGRCHASSSVMVATIIFLVATKFTLADESVAKEINLFNGQDLANLEFFSDRSRCKNGSRVEWE